MIERLRALWRRLWSSEPYRVRMEKPPLDLEELPRDPLEAQWEADRAYILDVAGFLESELGPQEKRAFLAYCLEIARQECGREIFFLAVRNYLRKLNRRARNDGRERPGRDDTR